MFRFTIRDVLLLTLIVGLAVGWWVDHRRLAKLADDGESWKWKANDLAAHWRSAGGTVDWYDTGNGWAAAYRDPGK